LKAIRTILSFINRPLELSVQKGALDLIERLENFVGTDFSPIHDADASAAWTSAFYRFIEHQRAEEDFLKELKYNRKLESKEAWKLLPYNPYFSKKDHFPTMFDTEKANFCVFKSEYFNVVTYIGDQSRWNSGASPLPMPIVANYFIPFDIPEYYFEIEILSIGTRGPSIGLTPNSDVADLISVHGWSHGSICLLTQTGNIAKYSKSARNLQKDQLIVGDLIDVLDSIEKWEPAIVIECNMTDVKIHYVFWPSRYDEWLPRDSNRLAEFRRHSQGYNGQLYSEAYCAPFEAGDIVGCLWDVLAGDVYFTRNGVKLSLAFSGIYGRFFPCVSLHDSGASVKVNFGQTAFKYVWQSQSKAEDASDKEKRRIQFEISEKVALDETKEMKSNSNSSNVLREQNALLILEMGVLPEAQMEQIMRALEINGDDLDRTVAWAIEHPLEFTNFARVDDSASIPNHIIMNDISDFQNSNSSPRSQNFFADNIGLGLVSSSSLGDVDASSSLNALLAQFQASLGSNERPQLSQILEQLRIMGTGVLASSSLSSDSDDSGPESSIASSLVDFARNNSSNQTFFNNLNCKLGDIFPGSRVYVSPDAKKMVFDKLVLLDEKYPPWFGVMDSCLGKLGTVHIVDHKFNLALIEIFEFERSRRLFWWFPIFCLFHAHKSFQVPSPDHSNLYSQQVVQKEAISVLKRLSFMLPVQILKSRHDFLNCFRYFSDINAKDYFQYNTLSKEMIDLLAFQENHDFQKQVNQSLEQTLFELEKNSQIFSMELHEDASNDSKILWEKSADFPNTCLISVTFHQPSFNIPNGVSLEIYSSHSSKSRYTLVQILYGPIKYADPLVIEGGSIKLVCRSEQTQISMKSSLNTRALISPIISSFLFAHCLIASQTNANDENQISALVVRLNAIYSSLFSPTYLKKIVVRLLKKILKSSGTSFEIPNILFESFELHLNNETKESSKDEKIIIFQDPMLVSIMDFITTYTIVKCQRSSFRNALIEIFSNVSEKSLSVILSVLISAIFLHNISNNVPFSFTDFSFLSQFDTLENSLNLANSWTSRDYLFYQKLISRIDHFSLKFCQTIDTISIKIFNSICAELQSDEVLDHISFVIWLNKHLRAALGVFALENHDSDLLFCQLIRCCRSIICRDVQMQYTKILIDKTFESRHRQLLKVKIDRTICFTKPSYWLADGALMEQGYSPDILHSIRNTIFGQLMNQLRSVPSSFLRSPKPKGASPHIAFLVKFQGEQVLGQAGPYRALFSSIARELEYTIQFKDYELALFIPTPNNIQKVGDGRHLMHLNPEWNFEQVSVLY
jgi:hypothetical protein